MKTYVTILAGVAGVGELGLYDEHCRSWLDGSAIALTPISETKNLEWWVG